jgi:NADH-quinone oxidoreductase subunit J
MVLFLFVVMMLDINVAKMREGFVNYLPIGGLFALALIVAMVWVVGPVGSGAMDSASLNQAVKHAADYSNTEALGEVLYTDYVLAFEVAAVILLVAIVAAIALTLRKRTATRYQTPGNQIKVLRSDRLKIIKMDAAGNPVESSESSPEKAG